MDNAGKPLTDYPRPSVAVDTAVLTVSERELKVLVVRREAEHLKGTLALPGTFLHDEETLAGAVLRSLKNKAGITGRQPRQLHVFDDPGRDDRGWVLSVAHVDAVPMELLAETLAGHTVELLGVDDPRIGKLPYDHPAIVAKAVEKVRADYRERPDPAGLVPEPFTLRELRRIHEAVLGEELQRDTFRRSMMSYLEPTGGMSDGSLGRPAALFRRKTET